MPCALPNHRTLPNSQQQCFELSEILRPKLRAPLTFDIAEDVVDFCIDGASASGEANHSRATFIGGVRPGEIPEAFETTEQLIHGLLADTSAVSQQARTNSIRTGILQHRHVWHAQVVEPGGVEFGDDAPVNGLSRNSKQGANQHLVRRNPCGRGR